MFQRLQTVFILISITIHGLIFFLPLSEIITESGTSTDLRLTDLVSGESKDFISGILLIVLNSILLILTIAAIYNFKNRVLQMRLSVYSFFLEIGMSGLLAYVALVSLPRQALVVYKVPLVLPLVAAILLLLAYRLIKKDEEKVRSIDRIR